MNTFLNRYTFKAAVRASHKGLLAGVLVFFALSAHAAPNTVSGLAFGTNDISSAVEIASLTNAAGTLDILYGGTTQITLTNTVEGFISINNGFTNFDISASLDNSSITGTGTNAALRVIGGTTLNIDKGEFIGSNKISTNSSSTGRAAEFINVDAVNIRSARFTGKQYGNSDSGYIGAEAIYISNGTITFNGDSTIITGGTGSVPAFSPTSPTVPGGHGILAENATVIISNGTFTGGSGAGDSRAGNALYSDNSVLNISDGTFQGGTSGFETPALSINNSSLNIISGGTFSGGSSIGPSIVLNNSALSISGGTFSENNFFGPAIVSTNSDLTITGGTIGTNGISSTATSGKTNLLELTGGTINKLSFDGEGTTYFTIGSSTNLQIDDGIVLDGGTVFVTNGMNDPLQNTTINAGDLHLINDFVLSSNGTFSLNSTNSTAHFNSLNVESNGVLSVGTGSFHANSDLTIQADGRLKFLFNGDPVSNSIAGTVIFHSNAVLEVGTINESFSAGVTNDLDILTVAGADSILIAGVSTNVANTTLFNDYVIFTNNTYTTNIGRISPGEVYIENGTDSILKASFYIETLVEWIKPESNTPLHTLLTEMETAMTNTMMPIIYDTLTANEAGIASEQTYLTVLNNWQTVLQGHQAAVGQAMSRSSDFREIMTMKPDGRRGPPPPGKESHGWLKYYGNFASQDATDNLQGGYDSAIHGGVIGFDKSFGHLLVGALGGVGNYKITADNDSESSINAFHGALYATIGNRKGYLEGGASYGHYAIETMTGGPFTLEGDFDSSAVSAYLGGGYGFDFKKLGIMLTPEAGVTLSEYSQDAFTETSTNAVPRQFEAFDTDSLQTKVGVNLSSYKPTTYSDFTMKWELRAHWIQEQNPEPGIIRFGLEGGTENYELQHPVLNEDLYRVGIGLIFRNPPRQAQDVMLRIDFNELFGDGFLSHNVSAKAIFTF